MPGLFQAAANAPSADRMSSAADLVRCRRHRPVDRLFCWSIFEQLERVNLKLIRELGHCVKSEISVASLNGSEISAVVAQVMSELFLGATARDADRSEVLPERPIERAAFVHLSSVTR